MSHKWTSDLIKHHADAGLPVVDVTELCNTKFMQAFLANVETNNVKAGLTQMCHANKFIAGNADFVASKVP